MFRWRRRATIIGDELKVVGKITAEGLVKVYGRLRANCNAARLSSIGKRGSAARSPPARSLLMAR